MSTYADRLSALRAELGRRKLDGFIIPLTDEHMSEYVGDYAQRLAWLTGFGGSAGNAAVLMEDAAMFTDGRYKVQVRQQVDGSLYSYEDVPRVKVGDWLAGKAKEGARIGYDAWLHTPNFVRAAEKALAKKKVSLVPVEENPVDAVWADQPDPSPAPIYIHEEGLAGRSSRDKRAEIASWVQEKGADAVVIAALDSIAWLFNIRGKDVVHTPVALSFAVVAGDGSARLFIDPDKVPADVEAALGSDVSVEPRTSFGAALKDYGGRTVVADPDTCVAAIFQLLDEGGATVIRDRDPVALPKAVKNEAELSGSRSAHLRDGAAISRFLKWLDEEAPKGELDELGAAARLAEIRGESNILRDTSFETISAAGPNAALPHYRVDEASNRKLEPNGIFLCDSGGQYDDGTTDITRTIIVGDPTAEMKDRFTRVLKGHIALATAVFPEGTSGGQLDAFARQYLWQAGLDYGHGTGHGVGSFLGVHEGPQRISAANYPGSGASEPLQAGMILSNEPGYYKEGAYGIRIENLVIVEEREIDGAEGKFFGFETITLAPIDLDLVEPSLLTEAERTWLNDYHAEVRAKIGPQMKDDEERSWLEAATRAI
ncbi:X-Pro aminopeptidase [Pacificimonas flava]|uniref:X-Pro aminopeptidase n=2 Tax=Pacificimonas TaxID=1960290 RepID=A0A219B928_9SPHN|nr:MULTISPECIES: aminopeptidase P family protein [Pacificimonas]MBZ6377052.1 aminopeptidase P family protein [Pacificimonas aurantium]OWV34674.1 X-Pro aminopeptidase [Pacificimonas flava]